MKKKSQLEILMKTNSTNCFYFYLRKIRIQKNINYYEIKKNQAYKRIVKLF